MKKETIAWLLFISIIINFVLLVRYNDAIKELGYIKSHEAFDYYKYLEVERERYDEMFEERREYEPNYPYP